MVKVKDETMPTPQGRRVIPRITSAMKVQAVKKGGAKKGKLKVCVREHSFCFPVCVCLSKPLFLQSESDGSVVMKMEFGGEDEEAGDSPEMGLAARLTKKVKKEPKDKGTERKCIMILESVHLESCNALFLLTCSSMTSEVCSFFFFRF